MFLTKKRNKIDKKGFFTASYLNNIIRVSEPISIYHLTGVRVFYLGDNGVF